MSNGLNTQEGQFRERERIGAPIPRVPYDYAGWRRQSAPLPKVEMPIGSQTPADFGESRFDSRVTLPQQLDNLNEFRAEEQTSLGKIANGIAKMGVFAGTTFLDGTVGLLYGAGNAIAQGDWSGLWDNEISNAMSDVQRWSEKALPNYYTESELDGNIHFTANFMGDKFLKNLGFTFGAIGSALLFNKGVGLLKLPKVAEYLTKSKQASAVFSFLLGNAVQSLNEARVEANNNSREWYETQKQQLDDYHERRKEELLSTAVDEADYARLSSLEDDAYQRALQRLGEDTAKMGNADMAGNFGLLMLTNSMGLGRMYARGFNTQRRILNASKKINKLRAGEALSTGTGRGLLTGLKDTFMEGAEEMSQSMIAKGMGNYYGNDVMSFYDASIDFGTTKNSVDMLNAIGKGIHEQLNDPMAWEEFLIGSLTGATGMIRVGEAGRNADVHIAGSVGLQGGILGATMEARRNAARENAILKKVNEDMAKPNITAMLRGINRHVTEQGKMDLAAQAGDSKAYKDAEYSQLISDIITFDVCGMLTDYKNLINTTLGNGHLTDEQLKSIREATKNVVDGKDIGPYAEFTEDADGNNKMREKLEQTRKALLDAVDQYQAAYKEIDMQTDGIFSEDQLAELVWMKTRLGDWNKRSKELTSSIVDRLKNLKAHVYTNNDGDLNQFLTVNAVEGEELTPQKLSAYLKSSGKRHIDIDKSVDALISIIEKNKNMLGPMLVSKADPKSNTTLFLGIQAWINHLQDEAKKDTVITDGEDLHLEELMQELRDLQQMTLDAQEFNSKLTEFMADPKKFEAAHKKSNRKAKKAETKQKAKDTIAKAQQATTKEEAQSIMDSAEPPVQNEMKNDPWVIYFNKKNDYLGQLEGSIDALEDIPDVYKNGAIDTLEDVFRFIQDPKTLEDFAKNPWSIINQLGLNTDPYVNYIIDSAFKKQLSNEEFAKLFSAYTPPVDGSVVFTKPESSKDGPDSNNPSVEPEPVSPEDKYTPAIDEPVSVPENAAEEVNPESNASVNSNHNGTVNFLQTGLPQIAIEDRVKKDKTTGQRTLPSDYNTPSWVTIDEKLPVNREAAWNYIYTTDDGRTITYKDLMMSPEFTKGSEIYFGIKPNIYYQTEKDVASGNKSYVVFMYYKHKDNYVPVGTIITIDDENEYFGAVPLIERITNDYKNNTLTTVKDMLGDDVFISPVLSTKVHSIESGFIPYLDHENNLKDVIKPEDINTKVRFSIVKNKPNQPGVFEFAGASDITNKIYHNPLTLSAWSGRIVMLIPRPDGKYNPVPVLTKSVTAEDIINNKTAPFYQDIYNTIVSLLQADNTFDASELVKQLRQLLYIGNTRIGYYNEKTDGTGYIKVKDEYDKNEANDLFQVLGFVNRTDYDEWDNNRKNGQNTVLPTRHLIKTGNIDTDVTNFINTILEVAGKHNQGAAKIYYNIDTSRLKDTQYIQDIINGSLLTCNIEKPETYGDFFTIPTYDPSIGQMFTVGTPASTNNPTNPRVIANPAQSGRSIDYSEYTNFYGSNYKGFVGENGVVRFYVGSMAPNNLLRSTATVTLGDGVTVPVVQVLEQIHYLHDNTHTNLYSRETKTGYIYKGQVAEVCIFNGIDNYIFVKTGDRYDIITNPNDIQTIKTTIQANKAASQIAAASTVQPQAPTNLAVSYNGVKSSSEGVYNGTKAGLDVLSAETHEGTIEDIYYVNNNGEVIHATGYKLPNSKVYLTARAVFKGTENILKVFFINENGYRSNSSLDVSLPVTLGADNIPTSFIANTVNELIASNPNIRKALDDATNALTSTDTSKDLRRFQVQEAAPQVTTEVPSAPSVIPENNPVRLYLEGMTNQFSTTDASGNKVINRTGGVYVNSFGHNYLRFHCMQGYFSDKEPSSFSIASNDPSRTTIIVSEPIIEGNIYDAYLRSYFIYGDTNRAAQDAAKAYEDFMRNVNPELRAIYDDKYKNKYLSEVQTKFKDVVNVCNRLKKAGYKFLTNNLIVSAALPYAEDKSNADPVTKYLRMAGEMDMLMEKDGEYYIVDFKNSKSNPSANEFYRTQLAFYKYALEASMPELKGKVHTYGWIWHDKTSDHDALIRPDNNEDINLTNCAIPTSANDVASMLMGNKPTNSLFFSRVAEKAAMELQANAGTVVQTSVEPKIDGDTLNNEPFNIETALYDFVLLSDKEFGKKYENVVYNGEKLARFLEGSEVLHTGDTYIPNTSIFNNLIINIINDLSNLNLTIKRVFGSTMFSGTVDILSDNKGNEYGSPMHFLYSALDGKEKYLNYLNCKTVDELKTKIHNYFLRNKRLQGIEELINHLRESGFTVKGKADMEKFLQDNDLSGVQESMITPEVEQEMQQIKAQAIANGTFMKAPNGNPTNLEKKQWLQVRTKAFKDWFGDWEKYAPKTGNNVLEELQKYALEDDKVHSKMIKYLLENFSNDITVYDSHKANSFNPRTGAISFPRFDFNSDKREHANDKKIVLHELVHSISSSLLHSYYLQRYSAYKKEVIDKFNIQNIHEISNKQVEAFDKILEIKKIVSNYIEQNPTIVESIQKKYPYYPISYFKMFEKDYGGFELDEFISEAFSNPALQEVMQGIKGAGYSSKETLFEQFLSWLSKVFNVQNSLLSDFFNVASDAFESSYKGNVSKVVDENGEPLVVYHHRKTELTDFSKRTDNVLPGMYFSKKPLTWFGPVQIAAFLNIKNPVKDYHEDNLNQLDINNYKKAGIDGQFTTDFEDPTDTKIVEYIAFDANQIKSATDNNGNFSPESNNIQELRTPDGNLYGFVDKDNNIYIDETSATLDTPIHEYTHLWDRVVAKENPELWQKGVDLMKQLPLWSEIENDPNYGGKWGNRNDKEFLIASEVHARIVGKLGEEVLKDHSDKPAIQALKDWLKEFWQAVKDTFAKWTNQDLNSLSITDFTNMPIRDFVNKEDLLSRLNAPTQPVTAQQPTPTISTTEEQLGALLRVVDETTDTTPANFDKELAWLKSHLGISENDGLEVIDTLINVNEHGLQAYGQFKDATIKLSRMMAKGTAYHEAFHAVFHLMLKPSEICAIVDEAQKLYNTTDALELEEKLANDFMEYMLDEEYVKPTLTARIKAFFTKLKRYLNHVLGMEDYLDNLFYRIKSGNFATAYSQDMAKSSTNATLISKAILANNGRSLDTTPDGQRSELYDALKRELEGTEEAIIAKAMAFSPDFIGWLKTEHANEDVYYPNGEVKSSFVLERLKQLGITDLHSYIPYNLPVEASDVDQGGRKISVKRYTKLVKDALNNIPASKLKAAYNKFVKDYLNKYGIEIIGTVKDKVITIKDVIDRRKHLNVFNTDGSVKSRQQIKADNKQVHAGSWETLTTKQHQLLAADNINEQLWNSLDADEQENILSCL